MPVEYFLKVIISYEGSRVSGFDMCFGIMILLRDNPGIGISCQSIGSIGISCNSIIGIRVLRGNIHKIGVPDFCTAPTEEICGYSSLTARRM